MELPKISHFDNIKKPTEEIKTLYRGVWAEHFSNNQELPIGGSLFNNELTTKLILDFSAFDEQLVSFTKENIEKAYEQGKEGLIDWLKKTNSTIDPYLFFSCYQTQQKINKLLEIDYNKQSNPFEREKIYSNEKSPKLSELKGNTQCGERAALGQYLLQKINLKSAYVSGVTMQDIKDDDEFPEDHSFIVLSDSGKKETSLIFDIARPISQHNFPRILETNIPFTYDLLKNKDELFIEANEVLQGGKLWFGVGEPVAGIHKTIEKE